MSALKLSIIVPVYNVEKYVEKCLESLCGLKIENEIIVVNDGTKRQLTWNSGKIQGKSQRWKYNNYIPRKNQGLSEARNNGLKAAKGEYISFY